MGLFNYFDFIFLNSDAFLSRSTPYEQTAQHTNIDTYNFAHNSTIIKHSVNSNFKKYKNANQHKKMAKHIDLTT